MAATRVEQIRAPGKWTWTTVAGQQALVVAMLGALTTTVSIVSTTLLVVAWLVAIGDADLTTRDLPAW
ncbi:MAG: hypothetical protein KY438_05250 [Actinobacteria bacterium]|nr:hypothetical protein [Actinomycetota bacterium]